MVTWFHSKQKAENHLNVCGWKCLCKNYDFVAMWGWKKPQIWRTEKDGNRQSQMKRLWKVRRDVISHEIEGGGQASGIKWILSHRVRRLTAGGNCSVSALVGSLLGLLAPLSGPEFQLLLNGVRLVFLSRCSPAGYTDKDTQNDDTTKQQVHKYTSKCRRISVLQQHEHGEINTGSNDWKIIP